MGRLNRYLFKQAAINIGGLIVFACIVLLLERLLRIFQDVSNSSEPAADATSMVINLLPHYLGMAVPMALLLGTIITIDRFSRSSELTAAMGAGISLLHMTKPFLIIGCILAGTTLFIEGYLQPVGRYNYNLVVQQVTNQSATAALREGIFTPVGDTTFFAGTDNPDNKIGPVFIHEILKSDGKPDGIRITTANTGKLIVKNETGEPILQLSSGRTNQIFENKELSGELEFESSAVAGTVPDISFRNRGKDERELTSVELFKNIDGSTFRNISPNTNNAALHLRLGRAALLIILPLIAVPFGLNYGRNPSAAGIVVGIVFLVTMQKLLEFGQSLGASGQVQPWIGIWSIIGAATIFALYIFRKSAYKIGQPPLSALTLYFTDIINQLKSGYRDLRSSILGNA